MADDYGKLLKSEKEQSGDTGLSGGLQSAGRGLLEAIPFTGEKLATEAGLKKPDTFVERFTRRAARNAPYALASAPFTGGVPSALGFLGATGLGQVAEEFGVPEEYQPVAEIAGQGAGQLAAGTLGRTIGYAEKPLIELYNKAKKTFDLGPGARTSQGMQYGHGDTPVAAAQNLQRGTELATERVGKRFKTNSIDDAWIKDTQDTLGKDVEKIFSGKTFYSDPTFLNNLQSLYNEANTAFGEKGNVIKTILEKNIGGQRPGGGLIDPKFNAMSLRGAIEDVNSYISTAEGPQAKILHKTAEALHDLAEANLKALPNGSKLLKDYQDWRKNYTAYATIRDTYQSTAGRTAAGQIPLDELHQKIINRSGSEVQANPLYKDLAEYGPIFRGTAKQERPGVFAGAMRTVSESPISKALQLAFQPVVPKRYGGALGKVQTAVPTLQMFSPAQQYTQTPSEQKKSKDPYAGLIKD
jgi:hypothetical protein